MLTDLARFVEEYLSLPMHGPVVLSDVQREFLTRAGERDGDRWRHKGVWAVWPKRSGKSLLVAAAVAQRLLFQPHSLSVILGPSERQAASVIFGKVRDLLLASTQGLDIGTYYIRNPENEARVITVPASEGTVQGLSVSGVLALDETHEVLADPTGTARGASGGALNLLLAQTEHPMAQVWVSSMLGSRDGLTFRTKQLADEGKLPHVLFSYETDAARINPLYDLAWREQQKAQLLPALYRVYHENAAGETAEALFDPEDIRAAQKRGEPYTLPLTYSAWQDLRTKHGPFTLTFGLDRSMAVHQHSDATVAVALGRNPEGRVWVLGVHEFGVGHTGDDILGHLADWETVFGRPAVTAMESYQCQDLAHKARHLRAELVHATPANQMAAFTAASNIFRDGLACIPGGGPADYLCGELRRLQCKARTDLSYRFEGHPHDDSAFAFGLALFALGQQPTKRRQLPFAVIMHGDDKADLGGLLYPGERVVCSVWEDE